MYVSEPSEEIPCHIDPLKEETPPRTDNSTRQGSPERQQWRRGRDSNPGDGCPPTCFPSTRTRPSYATSPKTIACILHFLKNFSHYII